MYAVLGWYTGLGRHALYVPLKGLHDYLRGLYSFELIYLADFGFCKVSILLFYLRVFATTRKRTRFIWSIMAFTILYTITFMLAYTFQCQPIHYFWTRIYYPKGGHCVNATKLYSARAVVNVFSDLLIYIYPMFLVWKLQQVSLSQKLGLIGMFLAGGV